MGVMGTGWRAAKWTAGTFVLASLLRVLLTVVWSTHPNVEWVIAVVGVVLLRRYWHDLRYWSSEVDAWLEQRAVVMVAAYALIGVGIGALDSSAASPLGRLVSMAFGASIWGLVGCYWLRRSRRRALNQPT
jgi:hypothetical protein